MIYTFTVNHTGSKVAIGALPGDDQVVPYVIGSEKRGT